MFDDPPHVSLPSPELLSQLIIPSSSPSNEEKRTSSARVPLFVAKCDLSDFFYRFRIPSWMQTYFGLPPLSSNELDMVDVYGEGVRVWPQLTVLAMGWSHSVFITQSIHEHLLDTATGMVAVDRIMHSNDLRIDRTRHMVYVDDLIIIGFNYDDIMRSCITSLQRIITYY